MKQVTLIAAIITLLYSIITFYTNITVMILEGDGWNYFDIIKSRLGVIGDIQQILYPVTLLVISIFFLTLFLKQRSNIKSGEEVK